MSGCGGAGSIYKGANSNTQAGLGTLIVTVQNATGQAVSDDSAIVSLDKRVIVVRDGKAKFYNVLPGEYFVEARSQSIGLPGEGRNIKIKADKTLNITLTI
jgi:hypothetical protein